MKIVVTGGAGFIGGNLCRNLVRRTEVSQVVVIDDLSTGRSDNLRGLEVETVVGSILDKAVLSRTVSGAHAVVHLAARPSVPRSIANPMASHDTNATGTLNVLEACREFAAHAIVASSSSVYGATATLPKHESLVARPLSPYAASKLAAEAYALSYQSAFGISSTVFRFFNVYGPLQSAGHPYAAVIPNVLEAVLAGRNVQIHGDGRQTRDFTYVDDVVSVLADTAIAKLQSDAPVNLAFGTRVSLLQLVDVIGSLLDRKVVIDLVDARTGDVRDSQASSDRLVQLFPTLVGTPLRTGLAHTIEWFVSQAGASHNSVLA